MIRMTGALGVYPGSGRVGSPDERHFGSGERRNGAPAGASAITTPRNSG